MLLLGVGAAPAFPNAGLSFHAGSDGKDTLLKSAKLAKSSKPDDDDDGAAVAAAPAPAPAAVGCCGVFLGDVKDRRVTVVVPLDETLAMLKAWEGWNPPDDSKPEVYGDAW